MKSRNVIISLILIVGMLVFIFIRLRLEPKKKLTFNRYPSRIEYSRFALCRMECYSINANSIVAIFRNGTIMSRRRKGTCNRFSLNTMTKQKMNIFLVVEQCGTVARVIDCYIVNKASCECADAENRPVSFLNSNS